MVAWSCLLLVCVSTLPVMAVDLSSRMEVIKNTEQASDALKFTNKYLVNYVGYSVDGDGNKGSSFLVGRSGKRLEIKTNEIVNWEGMTPKIDLGAILPKEASESSSKTLSYALPNERNTTFVLHGGNLFGSLAGTVSGEEKLASAAGLVTNLMVIPPLLVETVNGAQGLGTIDKDKFDWIINKSKKLEKWKDKVHLEEIVHGMSIATVMLEYTDSLAKQLAVGATAEEQALIVQLESMTQWLKMLGNVSKALGDMKVVAKKNNRYEKKLHSVLDKIFQIGNYGEIPDPVADFSNQLGSALKSKSIESKKKYLMLASFVGALTEAYYDYLKEESEGTEQSKKEAKQLRSSMALLKMVSVLASSAQLYELSKSDPDAVLDIITDAGIGFSIDLATELASNDVAAALSKVKVGKKIVRVASGVSNGISFGATLGNQVIPFLADFMLAPSRFTFDTVDGNPSIYGTPQTLLKVTKKSVNGIEELVATYESGGNYPAIVLAEGDKVYVKLAVKVDQLFGDRARWETDPVLFIQDLYSVSMSSPVGPNGSNYSEMKLCVGKPRFLDPRFYYKDLAGSAGQQLASCSVSNNNSGYLIDNGYTELVKDSLGNVLSLNNLDTDQTPFTALFTVPAAGYDDGAGIRVSFNIDLYSAGTQSLTYFIPVVVDTDRDEMPDAWEKKYGLDYKNSNDAGLDTDGDGLTNLEEFRRGSDPTKPDAVIQASPTSPTVSQTVTFWITDAWENIKTVVWTFSKGVASVVANVINSISEAVSYVFSQPGQNDVTVEYRDADNNRVGQGSIALTVAAEITAPNTPTGLQAQAGDGRVNLTWNGVEGASTYMLVVTPSVGDVDTILDLVGVSYTHTGLTNGVTYSYSIAALNSAGVSANSAFVSATPKGVERPQATGKLPDTGISANQCYAAGSHALVSCGSAEAIALNPAQDGMTGRDTDAATNSNTDGKMGFSYSKLGANGQTLAIQNGVYSESGSEAEGTKWSCVKDNVTGLIWEVKSDDGGLRDISYDWGVAHFGHIANANSARLCGASDWRLPTVVELQGLVNYGLAYPDDQMIDGNFFPTTADHIFWTSSAYVGLNESVWVVDFREGMVRNYYIFSKAVARLVRASQ